MSVVIEGEVVLPATVNCLEFFAPAQQVLGGRTWVEVQQLAVPAVEEFHGTCGIDCAIWFGRREDVDRRNRITAVVSLLFAFAGPASRTDVAVLDDMMRQSGVQWSPSAVTGLTSQAFPSVLVKSGKAYQVWLRSKSGPVFSQLVLRESGQVTIKQTGPDGLTRDLFLPWIRHSMGVMPKQGPQDLEMEQMRVAFALRFCEKVVEADGFIHPDEARFLERVFPFSLLERLDLAEVEKQQASFDLGCKQLPGILGYHDKLGFVGLLFAASHCDGQLAAEEMKVLKQAADVLDLDGSDVVEYLRRIW
jgi:uncharacterized tellurite resistance protein B-like protein